MEEAILTITVAERNIYQLRLPSDLDSIGTKVRKKLGTNRDDLGELIKKISFAIDPDGLYHADGFTCSYCMYAFAELGEQKFPLGPYINLKRETVPPAFEAADVSDITMMNVSSADAIKCAYEDSVISTSIRPHEQSRCDFLSFLRLAGYMGLLEKYKTSGNSLFKKLDTSFKGIFQNINNLLYMN